MKITRLGIVSFTLAFALPLSQAAIERTVEKSFSVKTPGTLWLDTQGGSIRVEPGPAGAVTIVAREKIRANSDAEADELLKKLDLTFEQTSDGVRARAKYERDSGGVHFRSWPPVEVSFVATVPAEFAADLHTSGGNVSVGDLAGAVKANTSGGNVGLGKLGATADVHTSGGDITLAEAHGEVRLDTSGGTIKVNRVAGPANLSTSGGDIRIDGVEQRVRAHTSGGNIRVTLNGPLQADCELSSSGGDVSALVDRSAAFRLDASTSGGSVDARGLTITIEQSNRGHTKLSGTVNGGGPTLKLRSSGGDVSVHTK